MSAARVGVKAARVYAQCLRRPGDWLPCCSVKFPLAAVVGLALLLPGCGSERLPVQSGGQNAVVGGSAGFTPYQTRNTALDCIRGKGISARPVGLDVIEVGGPAGAQKIFFAADRGAATGLQVRGKAEGAEVIGSALYYVGAGDLGTTSVVEGCL